MHRSPIILLFVVLFHTQLLAQFALSQDDPDPTRWINYSQTYVKIPIAQAGIYRITPTELKRAGIPIDHLDPTTVQLFHRGVEQAIYINGEADHHFDSSDFIEFYGRGNDGTLDSLLYRPHKAQPHLYYSLFNDTTAYFLTWSINRQPGKRMVLDTTIVSIDSQPEPYHWADELRVFTDTYPGWAAGLPYTTESSYYDPGEGYTGPIQSRNKPYTLTFQLTNPAQSGPQPQLDLLLVGRSYGYHQVNCFVSQSDSSQRFVDSVRFVGYVNAHVRCSLNWSNVSADGQLNLATCSQMDGVDDYSISYVRIRYPQLFMGTGEPTQLFHLLPNPKGQSLLLIQNIAAMRFWDVSEPTMPKRMVSITLPNNQVRLVVTGTETTRTILAVNQVKTVSMLQPVSFRDWRHRKPTYLIITHEALQTPIRYTEIGVKKLINAIEEYARYRASPEGGSHDTLTATMQQLFDQYSYGERHPLAIRRFAQQMLQQSNDKSPYLCLIGHGRSTPGIRRDSQQARLDMVMTAGFPGSDVALTAGLIPNEPDVPALPTGRINAGTPQEVLGYLAKVKAYELDNGHGLWRKNWLHLSGGQTENEQDLFRQIVDSYRDQALQSPLKPQITTLSKISNQPTESASLAKWVNEGVGLITFFGHSGLATTDLSVGFCTNDSLGYHNKGRYPLLLLNGCALGNFFYGRPTLATDWVLTPNRGAIAAIAQSHVGYVDVLNTYTSTFYQLLTDSTQHDQSLGQLQRETIRRVLVQNPGGRTLANAQQMVLQGDPAIRLFPHQTSTKPADSEDALIELTVYPNPFHEQTIFSYIIQSKQSVGLATLTVTDLNGHLVRHVVLPAQVGVNEWVWDGRNDAGVQLLTGLYLYSLTISKADKGNDTLLITRRLQGRIVLTR